MPARTLKLSKIPFSLFPGGSRADLAAMVSIMPILCYQYIGSFQLSAIPQYKDKKNSISLIIWKFEGKKIHVMKSDPFSSPLIRVRKIIDQWDNMIL